MSLDIPIAVPYRVGGGDVPAINGYLRRDGRILRDPVAIWRPRFVSGFTFASDVDRDGGKAEAFADWALDVGANGVRIMVGDLPWANQTAAQARYGLPKALRMLWARNLRAEVTCLTETARGGYNKYDHVHAVTDICSDFADAVIGEIANEFFHPTQDADTHDPRYLAELGQFFEHYGMLWSIGAPATDEPNPETHDLPGPIIKIHLGRTRDTWNMIRHVRELENVSAQYGRFVWNGEPIGWDETDEPGRRSNRPIVAFSLGVLSRGFELGLTSHSQAGLRADLPGPIQQACHEAAMRGYMCLPFVNRLRFENAGWSNSPVQSANFHKDDPDAERQQPGTVVRAFSFIDDSVNMGAIALVGLTGDPQLRLANGWNVAGIIDEMSDDIGTLRVLGISR